MVSQMRAKIFCDVILNRCFDEYLKKLAKRFSKFYQNHGQSYVYIKFTVLLLCNNLCFLFLIVTILSGVSFDFVLSPI